MRILITNQKGGVGKSTISANLAHYFASTLNKRTTLVDIDTQASSSKWVCSIKPQRITVFKGALPLSEGANRILIESRKIVQGVYGRSEIVIADLTWFDVFDSEMLLDFDIVILPSNITSVQFYISYCADNHPNRFGIIKGSLDIRVEELKGDNYIVCE